VLVNCVRCLMRSVVIVVLDIVTRVMATAQ
jgi:hypothetical protein